MPEYIKNYPVEELLELLETHWGEIEANIARSAKVTTKNRELLTSPDGRCMSRAKWFNQKDYHNVKNMLVVIKDKR